MTFILSLFFLFLFVLLESINSALPFVLIALIFLGIQTESEWVFLLAIIAGLILDSILFRPLGVSSIFFVGVLGALFLYGRKFEIRHIGFEIIFTALAVGCYLFFFSRQQFFFSFVISIVIAVGLFCLEFLLKNLQKSKDR